MYTVVDSFCAKKKKKEISLSLQHSDFHGIPSSLLFFFFLIRRRMCHDTPLISFQFFRSCRSPPSFLSLERTRRVHGGSPSIRDIAHSFSRISVNLDRLPLPPFLHPSSLSFFFLEQFSRFAWITTRHYPPLEISMKMVGVFYEFVSRRCAQSTVSNYLRDRELGERDAVDTSFQGYGRLHSFLWELSSCGERAELISQRYWIALILC